MNISALFNDYNFKSNYQYNQINSFVAASLLYIIGHYFSNLSNYVVLTQCCRNTHTCNFYDDIINLMFTEWKDWPLQIVVVNENGYKEVLGDRQYNIIFTDSYESFLQTKIHSYTEDYNKNEYYLIFLQTWDHLAMGEMQKIFEYCWQNYLINCVIQKQEANGRVLFFTYFPFTANYCGQVETVLVNEFNGTSLKYEDLFQKKLKNFYGCPLRAALVHIPPYVHLSTYENNTSYVSGGFEGKLLLELSRKLNFSLDIIVPTINETYKDVKVGNGIMTSGLKMVYDRRADITLGSIRQTKTRMTFCTASMYYYQTSWKVITLSEAYNLTSLETLMFPFARATWYLMTFIGILALALLALLSMKLPKYLLKHLDHITLDVLLIAVGMPAIVKPIFNTTRILKATWIIFSLILRTTYQALLFHLIRTHVTRNVPETLKEIVDQNYSLILDQHTFMALRCIPFFEKTNFIVMNTMDHSMPLKYLEMLPISKARYMAVAIPLVRFLYYIEKNRKPNVFKVLPQNVMNVKLSMFFSKHSFLVEQFDEVLMKFKGYGILDAWLIEEFDANFMKRAKLTENQIFGLKQLKMAFVLLLVGYMMAMLVFIVEILFKRVNWVKNLNTSLKFYIGK